MTELPAANVTQRARLKPFIRSHLPSLLATWHAVRSLPLRFRSAEQIFEDIYKKNLWKDPESRSGTGSNLVQTERLRVELPLLLREFGCTSMLDAPCGDFHWMSSVPLSVVYTGCDIVPALIEANQQRYAAPNRTFVQCDIIRDPLPRADLVFCRDCLVHLSNDDVFLALSNFKKSGATYLLTTTFSERKKNTNIVTGMWRALNLEAPPFNFPRPTRLLVEHCTEADRGFEDKSLALWRLSDLAL